MLCFPGGDPLRIEPIGLVNPALAVAHRHDFKPQQFLAQAVREHASVAVALDRGGRLPQVDAQHHGGLAHAHHRAARRRVAAALRPAQAQRLAGDDAELVVALQETKLVHHPRHDLRRGVDVRRRHVLFQADNAPDLPHVGTAQPLQFARAHRLRVADDPTFAAAQRDVHHGALPRHPRGQRAYRVNRLRWVEADAALGGAARVVVLHAKTLEHFDRAVVHAHRQAHVQFAQRLAQQCVQAGVELQHLGRLVQLLLRDEERVHLLRLHVAALAQCGRARLFQSSPVHRFTLLVESY